MFKGGIESIMLDDEQWNERLKKFCVNGLAAY